MSKPRQRETAVLVASDIHYGRKTSSYNPDVYRDRMQRLGRNLARIRNLLSEYRFDELVVLLLGDANDGSDIFATQPHQQAISNVEEQAVELADHLQPWLIDQKDVWGRVRVECVPGNHGRVSHTAHEAANWDIVCYRYLQRALRDKQIPVIMGRGDTTFVRKVRIRNHNYLLYHGHQIISFAGIPWYGLCNRLSRWSTSNLAPFDAMIVGHFHSFGRWQINKVDLLASGTMLSDELHALQSMGWESANKWWLFGVSDKRPMTWEFGLDLLG